MPLRRTALLAGALALVIASWAGYMWVRDFSLFRVKHVEVTGISGREAPTIRRALTEAGQRMTTLHVRKDELERAVQSLASVRGVSASADFPTTLHVRVYQYVPVAVLVTPDGRHVAVAGDGTLLGGVGASTKLPTIKIAQIPSSRLLPAGLPRTLVTVLAGAPAAMRPLLDRAFATRYAVEVPLHQGPTLYFGKPVLIAAKWAAAARVLADASSSGARFLDLRLPDRPAASTTAPAQRAAAAANTGAASPTGTAASQATLSGTTGPASQAAGTTGPGPVPNTQL